MSSKKKDTLSYHDITRIAAEAGAQAGVAAFERAKEKAKKERVDWRLRNTRLLLRKYRLFKMHAENAVYAEQREEAAGNAFDILEEMAGFDDALIVDSISKSAKRTKIIVDHIDTMLQLYRAYCHQSPRAEDRRHYRVIMALYIDEDKKLAREVAEQENIDTRTVYKDVDIAVGILSALLFGIDSVHIA